MQKIFAAAFVVTIVLTLTLACSVNTPSNNPNSQTYSSLTQQSSSTGGIVYKNLFKEIGKTEAEIDAKVNTAVSNFFYGSEDIRCYYPVESDMAYIYDAGNGDVRSEGMSYGMMIAVQMNMKNEFDKLWKWAKTYMQHTNGDRVGYFAWKCSTTGNKLDDNPAPDGEEYFAMALYFAWKRWGNGTGIYNYKAEADKILHHMLHQDLYAGQYSGVTPMINKTHKQIVFVPYASAAEFTDPSYHLPAFYELWAKWANEDNSLWLEVALASRELFKKTCHTNTGLSPDYANFDGTPKTGWGDHHRFEYDAWRTIMNISIDYYWWKKDSWAVTQANRLLNFFYNEGVTTYGNRYELDGTKVGTPHSPGLVAMNATAALISTHPNRLAFVQDLWNIQPTTGTWRYYDGCLYLLGLLHVSGKFRAWGIEEISSSSSINSSTSSISSSTSSSSSSSSPQYSSITGLFNWSNPVNTRFDIWGSTTTNYNSINGTNVLNANIPSASDGIKLNPFGKQDWSDYSGGYLILRLRSSNNIELQAETGSGYLGAKSINAYGFTNNGNWCEVTIPLSYLIPNSSDLTDVRGIHFENKPSNIDLWYIYLAK